MAAACTLADYNPTITAVKKFKVQAPGKDVDPVLVEYYFKNDFF
jgi:hypothetical protein